MNKHLFSIGIFGLLLALSGCHRNAKTSVNAALQQEAVQEKPLAFDTLRIEKNGPGEMNVHYGYVIDYPVEGPDSLVGLIRQSIFRYLGDSTTTADFTPEKLEAMGTAFVDHSVKEIHKYYGGTESERTVGYGNEGQIRITDQTERYLTFLFDSYLYTGGAHGMPTRFYFTVDKVHNRVMHWDDLFAKEHREALGELLRTELNAQYYRENPRSWKEDFFAFKLPEQTPALTREGVVFMYESYEIDCYAAGTPYCVIPYEKVKRWLTKEALDLIP